MISIGNDFVQFGLVDVNRKLFWTMKKTSNEW